jgi:hypothetical protein
MCFHGARLACEADLKQVATQSLGFVGQAVLVVLVLESGRVGIVGVLEYRRTEFPAMSALILFTALIYEMAVADVHDTITSGSQVLVMGYYHQSFLFLTDQSRQ